MESRPLEHSTVLSAHEPNRVTLPQLIKLLRGSGLARDDCPIEWPHFVVGYTFLRENYMPCWALVKEILWFSWEAFTSLVVSPWCGLIQLLSWRTSAYPPTLCVTDIVVWDNYHRITLRIAGVLVLRLLYIPCKWPQFIIATNLPDCVSNL